MTTPIAQAQAMAMTARLVLGTVLQCFLLGTVVVNAGISKAPTYNKKFGYVGNDEAVDNFQWRCCCSSVVKFVVASLVLVVCL